MKKLTWILTFLLIFMFSACGMQKVTDETVPTYGENSVCGESVDMIVKTAPTTPAVTEKIPESTVLDESIPIETNIHTKYYSLTLPDSWGTCCFYSVFDDTTLVLREADSYESFGGGKLCTLMLIPTDDETYKDFPDYELLASLDTPEGSFYVIALFPTDVQFTEDTMDTYNEMYDQLMDVLYTLQPNDGIEMAMP